MDDPSQPALEHLEPAPPECGAGEHGVRGLGRMGLEERLLYHQAHPLKLVVDAGAGLGALVLFWAHA